MHFVNRALARRLESAEEVPQVFHAEWCQRNQPSLGAAVEEIAGGHMVFAGLGSPIGRAVGMGFSGPVNATDMDRLEHFYFSRGAPAQVDYCPLTDTSLLDLAKERGYGIAELNNVLSRPTDELEKIQPSRSRIVPGDLLIRASKPEEAAEFAGVVRQGFFPDGGEPARFDEMIMPMFVFPGSLTFVAEHEGKIVATGAALVIPEHRIVGLYGAATLNPYRGRGLQSTLLAVRMQVARESGCEYAVIVTQGGTTSQRNAERLGFRVAYSKATLIRQNA